MKCFFKVLLHAEFANRCELMLKDAPLEQNQVAAVAPSSPAVVTSSRSDAVTLLATLQREARFVDIVNESLDGYSDAQIGAAARNVLRDCAKVLARIFALRPLLDQAEGATVRVPAGYETECYRLTGDLSREPPFAGKLMHAGWQATKCDLPTWTGSGKGALVVAPAEVQLG
ncbi:MAG: DUF2760 domain-containing protein [Planctomycetaceae bacterium]|jgi:hypothetical protein|nr:DUF2760 domain-containing protein [Planctomycetaceae bacterium]